MSHPEIKNSDLYQNEDVADLSISFLRKQSKSNEFPVGGRKISLEKPQEEGSSQFSRSHILAKFLKRNCRVISYVSLGITSFIIGIILIVLYYAPSTSSTVIGKSNEAQQNTYKPLSSNYVTAATPYITSNTTKKHNHLQADHQQHESKSNHQKHFAYSSQSLKDEEMVSIYTLRQINNLHDSTHSIKIKSLNTTKTKFKINSNQNVHKCQIEAQLTKEILTELLTSFDKIESLIIKVDQLICPPVSTEQNQPGNESIVEVGLQLSNIKQLKLVQAISCPQLLDWIFSAWNIEAQESLIICRANINNTSTFEAMHDFINSTSSSIEEIVLHETNLCLGCNFFDIKFDNLKIGQTGDETEEGSDAGSFDICAI